MKVLGISCFFHDAAATLVDGGRVVAAAAEERFTRKKHDNHFPEQAIRYCLSWRGISIRDCDAVVFYEKPIRKFDRVMTQHVASFPRSLPTFLEGAGSWLDYRLTLPKMLRKTLGYTGPVWYCDHHVSHAVSAYTLSGFRDAAIVTVDGVGEWATATTGRGRGSTITLDREIRFPHSLGLLYSALTVYLGFEANDAEYKVMGLAAYGDPRPFAAQMDALIRTSPDGSFSLNMKYFDFVHSNRMFSGAMERLFGHPARTPENPMQKPYEDIAAALQRKLEAVLTGMLTAAHKKYRSDNLCFAGGVALNSVANGKLLKQTPFKQLFIPPDPGDAGGSMGAALWGSAKLGDTPETKNADFTPYLGPSFSDGQIRDVLESHGLPYRQFPHERDLVSHVAALLERRKVVGWFQGRMEWGPRALGGRSILATATDSGMKDIINARVKHRELFRPFAPVILDRYAKRYFKTDNRMPVSAAWMLLVYPFTPYGKKRIPATVHVDGSGRLETLRRRDNPLYYDVIDAFRKRTGIPAIINTSFNVRGEPIVATPEDAVQCFLKTDIDVLCIGSFLVKKSPK